MTLICVRLDIIILLLLFYFKDLNAINNIKSMNNIQHLQSVSTTNPLTNTYTSEEVSLEFCESDIKADKFIDISRKSNIQSFIDAITKRLNELFCKFNEVNNIDVNSRKGKTLLKTLFYFFFWYFFTVVYNISNKKLLNDFPLPFTVASLQLLIGLPVFMPLWIMKPINYNVKNIWSHSRIALMHGKIKDNSYPYELMID